MLWLPQDARLRRYSQSRSGSFDRLGKADTRLGEEVARQSEGLQVRSENAEVLVQQQQQWRDQWRGLGQEEHRGNQCDCGISLLQINSDYTAREEHQRQRSPRERTRGKPGLLRMSFRRPDRRETQSHSNPSSSWVQPGEPGQ